jgi:protein-S-isoprenylcysteine O-methyltransferase Ste14
LAETGIITLKHNHQLITTGPYRLTPIYTGWLTALLGTCLSISTPLPFVGLLLVTSSFLLKIRREESLSTFGDSYRSLQSRTPTLIPFLF